MSGQAVVAGIELGSASKADRPRSTVRFPSAAQLLESPPPPLSVKVMGSSGASGSTVTRTVRIEVRPSHGIAPPRTDTFAVLGLFQDCHVHVPAIRRAGARQFQVDRSARAGCAGRHADRAGLGRARAVDAPPPRLARAVRRNAIRAIALDRMHTRSVQAFVVGAGVAVVLALGAVVARPMHTRTTDAMIDRARVAVILARRAADRRLRHARAI